MEDGGWRMGDGGWRIEDGGWEMEDGGWRIEDGGLKGFHMVCSHSLCWSVTFLDDIQNV